MADEESSNPPAKPAAPKTAQGPLLGQPAGARRGFVPPKMDRQKVEVARAKPIPPAARTEPPPPPQAPSEIPLDHADEVDSIPPASSRLQPQSVYVSAPATEPPAKRLPRRPLLRFYGGGILSALLFLAALALAGLWIHSLGAIDRAIYATTTGEYYWIESSSGAIYIHTERDPSPIARQLDVWRFEFGDPWSKKDPPPTIAGAALTGITHAKIPSPGSSQQREFWVISYWLIVLVLMLPPIWWFKSRKRLAARCRKPLCRGCGGELHDMSPNCPQCGLADPLAIH
ncbi:MAG TPA: hypothetical protein VH370_03870 [Humisphaera sp.]|jgi:hypothetical protein|nr:hypothetical protein [Humisphaera sp.]